MKRVALRALAAAAFVWGLLAETFFGRVETTYWMICIIVANFVLIAKGNAEHGLILVAAGLAIQWGYDRLKARARRRRLWAMIEARYGARRP